MSDRSLLVLTAHPGDFVWRCAGAIALAVSRGERVVIGCMSFGERGESASLWRKGFDLDQVKAHRREEAERAAELLGAEIRFYDAGDYPLLETAELRGQLIALYREVQPSVVLTHAAQDFYAHSNYIDLWLSRHTNGTYPDLSEINPVDPELIGSPDLRSGKLYYPLELLSFIKYFRPLVLPRLPRDSHAWMNIDSPEQGFKFDYVMQASIQRTVIEFEKTTKDMARDSLELFVGRE